MKKYQFEQFVAARRHTLAKYSHDGNRLGFIVNTSGQFNLWVVPSGGGVPIQMTSFEDDAVRDFAWSHDDSQIAFIADANGSEFYQVYIMDSKGGWPQRVTDRLDVQYGLAGWSPDDQSLLYSGNDNVPSEIDPLVHNLKTGEIRRLMTGHRNYAAGFSPDGKYINVVQFNSNTDANIFVVESDSGEAALVTGHEGQVKFFPADWKHDSSGFYITTNHQHEFDGAGYYDLQSGKWDWVFKPDADVEGMVTSDDGDLIIFVVNEGGMSRLYAFDGNHKPVSLPPFPTGVIAGMSLKKDKTKLAVVFSSAKESHNIYEFDLKTGAMVALNQSMLGGLDLDDLVDPELIHYETFDGKMIPAWLYKPKTAGDKFPVVLSIHGGPEAQERPNYNYFGLYQYLLNHGIAVLAPNIRGSTGFGISYQKLIHRDWGGAELKDIEYAAKYLQSLNWIDQSRMAVFGGSFGGFATLSAMTRLPDYWAVGVDIVGPSNLVTFVKSVPPHWKPIMKTWVGDAEEDYDFLMERSPITYVKQIKAPLLIIQGANDPRVVKAESDQMVEVMKANGNDVTYYVDEEEGHGATRRKNGIKWYRMIAEYLETHLTQ